MNQMNIAATERRARLAAERLLELKQAELFAANSKLSKHALKLSDEIVEKREEVENVRHVADELRGKNSQVLQDLEQANHATDIAERRLWDSVETVQDGFAVFDNTHTLIAANSAYLSVFEGMECVTPGIDYGEIAEILVQEGIVDIGSDVPATWLVNFLDRWRSDDLEPVTIKLWNGQFIKLVDRRSLNGDTVSLALNITDTIHNEKQLNEARDKAESANRAKSAFLAKMSHELRTPMNGVVGMADLLIETELSEEQHLFVDTIRTSGEALLDLINDVLDFSKMEAAKLVLHAEKFDLELCINEVVRLFQPAIQTKPVDVFVDFDMFLPTTYIGDSGRIRQVLTNLVGNAVKFTAEGHVLIRVVGLPVGEQDHVKIHITVEDTGLGIPTNMISHVFGEFNQVEDEKNRKFEGTGLGLAISRQLVDLMGGEIWVDSEEGIGSSFGFHITLPTLNDVDVTVGGLPEWLNRIVFVSAVGVQAKFLSNQMAPYDVEILELMGIEELKPRLGDLLIMNDAGKTNVSAATIASINDIPDFIPIIVPDPGFATKPPTYSRSVITLQRPLTQQLLVSAISEIAPLSNAPENTELTTDLMPEEIRRMRILAAEDNKTNRLVFSKLVKSLNIELEFAENGREAVEMWQSFHPDIIFMDISMPEMDGKEATAKIRELEYESKNSRTPIVALTAHAMTGDNTEIMACGLDYYLTKPLKKDLIFGQIRERMPTGIFPVFEVVAEVNVN